MILSPKTSIVGIIGGNGNMGKFFAKAFGSLDFKVMVSDIGTKLTNKKLIEKSNVVIFSVPLHLSEKIILKEIRHVRKDQLVMDISSLKNLPIKAMLKGRAEVIGLHPMFGSTIGFAKQIVIFCPARAHMETVRSLKKLFVRLGAKVTTMNPVEHDKLMSLVQVVPHLKTMLMAEVLMDRKVNMKETLKTASSIYRLELNILERIFAQNGDLYANIITQNSQSMAIVKSLRKALDTYEKAIRTKDAKIIGNRYNILRKFFL